MSWQEIIKEFTAEKKEGNGFAASVVLMYLAFGQDYAYNMAKRFKKEISLKAGWKNQQLTFFSRLKDVNQLHLLLDGMEKKGLLKSYKKEKGRRQRYFRLNEDVIITPYSNEGLDKMLRELSKNTRSTVDETKERVLVERFLVDLSNKSMSFRHWSKIEKFDYLAFLGLLKEEAKDAKNEEMVSLMNKNIHKVLQGEREAIKLKADIQTVEKIRSENKARGIKDELSTIDNLLDKFEENTR